MKSSSGAAISAISIFLLLLLMNASAAQAQNKYAGRFWAAWGYNRTIYEASDIHLGGPGYEITIYKAQAHDRPTPFSFAEYFNPVSVTIPQFNLRLGYNITENWYLSFSFGHMKYVMDNNQYAKVSGYIEPGEYPKYGGSYLSRWMPIEEDFLTYEHTDGFNYYSFEVWRRIKIATIAKDRLNFQIHAGASVGMLVPRTDMWVLGEHSDNEYHIAGAAMAVMGGPYVDWKNRVFMQFMFKPGLAGMPDILVHKDGLESASQNITFYQMNLTFGYIFGKKKSDAPKQ